MKKLLLFIFGLSMIFCVSSCGSLDQGDSKVPAEAENPKEEIKDSNESKDNTDSMVSDNTENPKEEIKDDKDSDDSKDDKDSDKVYDDNIVWGPLS